MSGNKRGGQSKAATIRRMLEAFAVPHDGVLMVHSAFKGFARDGYDARATLAVLADYMEAGTLLLPTMSWRYVNPDRPVFDELETPSNVGVLAEIFRREYATRRSLHPTHSVAGRGARVDELLNGHHLDETPCSANSPFGRLAASGGHVVMMDVGMDCCTLIHCGEELVAPETYLRGANERETYVCRDRHGGETEVNLRRHLFLPRNYWQFQDRLAAKGRLAVFRCDNAVCRGFKADDMLETVCRVLRRESQAVIAKPGQRYRMM